MANITMGNGEWVGLGSAAGRLVFNDQTKDALTFKDCFIGVGLDSPSALVTLNDGNFPQLRIENDDAGEEAGIRLRAKAGGYNLHADILAIAKGTAEDEGYLGFRVPYTSDYRLVIDHTGAIGAGTTSPAQKLEIQSATLNEGALINNTNGGVDHSTPLFLAGNNNSQTPSYSNVSIEAATTATTADMIFRTGGSGTTGWGTARLIIKNDGLIGLGTVSPVAKLDVNGTLRAAGNVTLDVNAGGGANTLGNCAGGTLDLGGSTVTVDGQNAIILKTYNGTERMRVALDGNVGVGIVSPTEKLHVNGSILTPEETWVYAGTNERKAYRDTHFGYNTGYRVLQIGEAGSSRAIALGVDLTGNTDDQFMGNEIVIPNNKAIIAPNHSNNSYLGVLKVDDNDKILIGGSTYSLGAPILFLDPSSGNVGIGITYPYEKLEVDGSATLTDGYLTMNYITEPAAPAGMAARLYIDRNEVNAAQSRYFPKLMTMLKGQRPDGMWSTRKVAISTIDWVNVKDFGATGDGTTDDLIAIQAAIDSLAQVGGTVYFPTGTYLITNTIYTYAGIQLIGASAGTAWDERATQIEVDNNNQEIDAISTYWPIIYDDPDDPTTGVTSTFSSASSGQADIDLVSDGGLRFKAGDSVAIYDSSHFEVNEIDVINGDTLTMVNNLGAIYTNGTVVAAVGSSITSQANSGQKNVEVSDGSVFTVGDPVVIRGATSLSEPNTVESKNGNILTMVNTLSNTYHVGDIVYVENRFLASYDDSGANLSMVQSSGWTYMDGISGQLNIWLIDAVSNATGNKFVRCIVPTGKTRPAADNNAEIYPEPSYNNVIIKNFNFWQKNGGKKHTALKLWGTQELLVENVQISSFNTGIKIDRWINTVFKCSINYCNIGIDLRSESYYRDCNATTLYGCHVTNCSEYGIRIRGQANAILGGCVEGCRAEVNNVDISGVSGSGPWTITLGGSPDFGKINIDDTIYDESDPQRRYRITAKTPGSNTVTVDDYYNEGTGPSDDGDKQAFTRKDAVGICIDNRDTDFGSSCQENYISGCYTEQNDVTLEIGSDANKIMGNRLVTSWNAAGVPDTVAFRWKPNFVSGDYVNVGNCLLGNSFFDPASPALYYRDFVSGNVGINQTSPDRKLEILDPAYPQLRLTHTNDSAYCEFQVDSSGSLEINPSGSGTVIIGADAIFPYDVDVNGNIEASGYIDVNGPRILSGTVDPIGTGVSAPQGSIYMKTNGGSGSTIYAKHGSGNTDWHAL